MRVTSILLFILLAFFLWTCEKDQIVTSSNDEADPQITQDSDLLKEQPAAYRGAGIAYRDAIHYQKKAIQAGEIEFPSDEIVTTDPQTTIDALNVYESIGYVTQSDVSKLQAFMAYVAEINVNGSTDISHVRGLISNWVSRNGVKVEKHPVTYHSIMIVKEALFKNQLTLLREANENFQFRGADDGTLCTVSGFLCSQTNAAVSAAARTAASQAAAAGFKGLINFNADDELTIFESGLSIGIAAAINGLLTLFWDQIFCNIDCDMCAPAIGIIPVFNETTCQFLGIEAAGSFEFAERWNFSIDANRDGTFGAPQTDLDNFVPSSSLPNNTFDVFVDVACDGNTDMAWPVGTQQPVTVDPNATFSPPNPTGTISVTPSPNNGMFYRTGTQYCFRLNNLNRNGWTFNGWFTTSNASPSSGGSNTTFCTTFSTSFPTTAGVNARFTHPCSSTDAIISAGTMVVCPPGSSCY